MPQNLIWLDKKRYLKREKRFQSHQVMIFINIFIFNKGHLKSACFGVLSVMGFPPQTKVLKFTSFFIIWFCLWIGTHFSIHSPFNFIYHHAKCLCIFPFFSNSLSLFFIYLFFYCLILVSSNNIMLNYFFLFSPYEFGLFLHFDYYYYLKWLQSLCVFFLKKLNHLF